MRGLEPGNGEAANVPREICFPGSFVYISKQSLTNPWSLPTTAAPTAVMNRHPLRTHDLIAAAWHDTYNMSLLLAFIPSQLVRAIHHP